MRVSFVVLCRRGDPWVGDCLDSLERQTIGRSEIVVVETGTRDTPSTAAGHHARPFVITSGDDAGRDLGWRATTGEVVIFLGADCSLTPHFAEEMLRAFDDRPDAGIIGGKLYYPNTRRIHHAGGILLPNGVATYLASREPDHGQCDEARIVDFVSGAGMAVRREVLDDLRGFDGEYGECLYASVDLCTRARAAAWNTVYMPGIVAYHAELAMTRARIRETARRENRGRVLWLIKNRGIASLLFRALPCELRWLLSTAARGRRFGTLLAYVQALLFTLRCLRRGCRHVPRASQVDFEKGLRAILRNLTLTC